MTRALIVLSVLSLAGVACAQSEPAADPDLAEGQAAAPGARDAAAQNAGVRVPPGFTIELFADGLGNVRTLRTGPDGLLYAAISEDGRVVRFDPAAANAEPETVADDLSLPYGLDFHEGDLYVGEGHQVIRLDGPDFTRATVVVPNLPTGGHWTRELVFGADGMLYVSVGSSCNLCEERDERRAAVTRYRPDGSGQQVIARGLRNAAGLAVHPGTGAVWASQNERDNLGDDVPPEEINVLTDGADFGWPYCYGQRLPNPEYRDRAGRCAPTTPPALEIQAHSAPLGVAFYTGDQFPEEYRGDFFVAFHGSWNRREPTGYLLAHVDVQNGRPVSYQPFAQGWLQPNGRVTGRPVYPAVGSDGALYLSDDGEGRIWRIRWTGR
jgi:glucose/arabinose dehydrogenase